jgi:signal transduction histidine kinase
VLDVLDRSLARQPVPVAQLPGHLPGLLGSAAGPQIDVVILDASEGVAVTGDLAQLSSALRYLARNACEAMPMPDGGAD